MEPYGVEHAKKGSDGNGGHSEQPMLCGHHKKISANTRFERLGPRFVEQIHMLEAA